MMKNWILKLLGIDKLLLEAERLSLEVKRLRGEVADHKYYVEDKVNHYTEYTRVDTDIGMRGKNTVVLTGMLKGRGFVQFYDVDNQEFAHLVERMKYLKKEHLVRNVDSPMGFDFKGYFKI
jgi:hypothetical protein